MKKLVALFVTALSLCISAYAQDVSKDIIKTGTSFAPFPIIAYDADRGLELGAMLNIYNFGDGSAYPNPKDQWFIQAAYFTKGSYLVMANYDNKNLFKGVRFNANLSFYNEKALDFYGFNGYDSGYDPSLGGSFYRHGRALPYFKADFTGHITKHLYWKAGYHFKYFKISEYIPEGGTTSHFSNLVAEGVIKEDEKNGGFTSSILAGLMYDTRDFEPSPSKGLWIDANLEGAPKWLGTSTPYLKYYAAFRHYVPVYKDKLVFAMRANVQGYFNDPAFYVLPIDAVFGNGYDHDGMGGYFNLRGILRNRITGKSTFYFNTELRWRFVEFHLWKQNIAFAVNGFFEGGRAIVPYRAQSFDLEKMHLTAGGGIRFIMNRNFILAAEYGAAFNALDRAQGKAGSLYVNVGYLF